MLMAVEADAVADAVGEEVVVRAETGSGDHGTGGIVNRTGKFSGAGRVERDVLRFADSRIGSEHFFGGLAENSRAGDVRLVALDRAAAIDQDNITFLPFLRLPRPVRESRGCAEKHERAAAKVHLSKTSADEVGDILLGHSFFNGCENLAVNVNRGFAGEAHEFEFVGGFARTASDGHRVGSGKFKAGRGGAEMVVERERESLFDADAAGADVAVGE